MSIALADGLKYLTHMACPKEATSTCQVPAAIAAAVAKKAAARATQEGLPLLHRTTMPL